MASRLILTPLIWLCLASGLKASERVSYSREVKPILAKACVSCHGPDAQQRKADLRLDTREGLLDSGVIHPGSPDTSELILRLLSHDPDEVMPPPKKGDPLTSSQIALLQRWIREGASYEDHWAFLPITKAPLPALKTDQDWVRQPFDSFVLHHLQTRSLLPAPEADPEDWLRRTSLATTGLPPTLEELDSFLAQHTTNPDNAKDLAATRLLASPAYGERMANEWLDLARYADTYGRHEDHDCITWPYRDWVIRAYNENLPLDQFIIWQLAGDLLPNPTQDQRIATCFNRLAAQSNEAGSNPEEFRINQVSDRVNVMATAFLGLTTECSRCHDHKFDPLTMEDFYGLSAFFNNIEELGLFTVFTGGVPPPTMLIHDQHAQQRLQTIQTQILALQQDLQTIKTEAAQRFSTWLESSHPPRLIPEKSLLQKAAGWFSKADPPAVPPRTPEVRIDFESHKNKIFTNSGSSPAVCKLKNLTPLTDGFQGNGLELLGDNMVMIEDLPEIRRTDAFSFGLWVKPRSHLTRAVLVHRSRAGLDAACRGLELILDDMHPSFALCHFSPGNEIRIRSREPIPLNTWTHITCTYDGSSSAAGLRLYINGQPAAHTVTQDHLYKDIVYREEWGDETDKDGVTLSLALCGRLNDASFYDGVIDDFVLHLCELTPPEVMQLTAQPDSSAPEDWFDWYLREQDSPWRSLTQQLHQLRQEENELSAQATELMVMQERTGERRPTHLLDRGQFDQPSHPVQARTPAFLPPLPELNPVRSGYTRLDLAHWITSRENPLTARVQVNHIWQILFGRGLVETSEDFGTQGSPPDHPELLDWLAAHFMEIGWDTKALIKSILLSATFSQSGSPRDPRLLQDDPQNTHLARGPRHRLSAEQIRDLTLFASGLLSPKIGGPSVRPYQPRGLWIEAGTQHSYGQHKGENLYRRSLYTFWRRTLAPANMTVFDAPTREFCIARRDTTHTPLQALVLMNDVQFMEAARLLATHHLAIPDDQQRITQMMRRLTSRTPSSHQLAQLTTYLNQERQHFSQRPTEETDTFLRSTGQFPLDEFADPVELAAHTMLSRLLFGYLETTYSP